MKSSVLDLGSRVFMSQTFHMGRKTELYQTIMEPLGLT